MNKKYFFTEQIDDMIREVYRDKINIRSKLHTGYLKDLSKRLGIPDWRISKRAVELGAMASQKKEPNWSDRELRILQSSAHLSLPRIQVNLNKLGFHRTQQGIQQKRKHMRFLQNLNGNSISSVAECFGVDKKTVVRWIKNGLLKSTRRETTRTAEQGELFFIKDKWIREFVVDSVAVIDFRKIDKYWVVDLLAN